jgi:hypothetical protein
VSFGDGVDHLGVAVRINVWVSIAGVLGVVAPVGGAAANHCSETDLIVLSRTATQAADDSPRAAGPSTNANALVCAVAPDEEAADTRVLTPGATEVSVRYTNDAGTDHLDGVLDGLGFVQLPVMLQRHVIDMTGTGNPTGIFVFYDMPEYVTIPAGLGVSGAVTASITMPGGVVRTVTFHTAV